MEEIFWQMSCEPDSKSVSRRIERSDSEERKRRRRGEAKTNLINSQQHLESLLTTKQNKTQTEFNAQEEREKGEGGGGGREGGGGEAEKRRSGEGTGMLFETTSERFQVLVWLKEEREG
jgi:hypothetical protein